MVSVLVHTVAGKTQPLIYKINLTTRGIIVRLTSSNFWWEIVTDNFPSTKIHYFYTEPIQIQLGHCSEGCWLNIHNLH